MYLGVFILAFAIIGLGIQGFTSNGIPWSDSRRIVGTPARITGGIILLLGVSTLGFAVWFWNFEKKANDDRRRNETRRDELRQEMEEMRVQARQAVEGIPTIESESPWENPPWRNDTATEDSIPILP